MTMDIRAQLGINLPDSEKRELTFGQFEMRKTEAGPEFVGYASVFDLLSGRLADEGNVSFRERINRGAFKDVLAANPDVVFNVDHSRDVSSILGRTSSGTATLVEDPRGLQVRAVFPNTTLARDLKVSIERGDISSMSFAFRVAPGGEAWAEEGGEMVRTISRMGALGDVSIVTDPAYPDADIVSLRSNTIRLEEVWGAPTTRNDAVPDDGINERTDEFSETSIVNDSNAEVTNDQAAEVETETITETSPEAESDTLLLGARNKMAQLRLREYES